MFFGWLKKNEVESKFQNIFRSVDLFGVLLVHVCVGGKTHFVGSCWENMKHVPQEIVFSVAKDTFTQEFLVVIELSSMTWNQ